MPGVNRSDKPDPTTHNVHTNPNGNIGPSSESSSWPSTSPTYLEKASGGLGLESKAGRASSTSMEKASMVKSTAYMLGFRKSVSVVLAVMLSDPYHIDM
ncbi:MAG: hypothetical protein ACQ9MH_26970 [Nitrospinales bacterium]